MVNTSPPSRVCHYMAYGEQARHPSYMRYLRDDLLDYNGFSVGVPKQLFLHTKNLQRSN